jgi:hypothetical protein
MRFQKTSPENHPRRLTKMREEQEKIFAPLRVASWMIRSLVAEGFQRIDLHGAAGRGPTRQQRYADE